MPHHRKSLLLYCQSLHDASPIHPSIANSIKQYFLNLLEKVHLRPVVASNSVKDDASVPHAARHLTSNHTSHNEGFDVSLIEYDPVLAFICTMHHEKDSISCSFSSTVPPHLNSPDGSRVFQCHLFTPQCTIHQELISIVLLLISNMENLSNPEILCQLLECFLVAMNEVSLREGGAIRGASIDSFSSIVAQIGHSSTNGSSFWMPMKLFLKAYYKCRELKRLSSSEDSEDFMMDTVSNGSIVESSMLKSFLIRLVCELKSPIEVKQEVFKRQPNMTEWHYRFAILAIIMKKENATAGSRYKSGTSGGIFEESVFKQLSQITEEQCNSGSSDEMAAKKQPFHLSNICQVIEFILQMGETDSEQKHRFLWYVLSLCQQEKKVDFVQDFRRITRVCPRDILSELCQEIIEMMNFDVQCREDPHSLRMMCSVIEVLKQHGGVKFYQQRLNEVFGVGFGSRQKRGV